MASWTKRLKPRVSKARNDAGGEREARRAQSEHETVFLRAHLSAGLDPAQRIEIVPDDALSLAPIDLVGKIMSRDRLQSRREGGAPFVVRGIGEEARGVENHRVTVIAECARLLRLLVEPMVEQALGELRRIEKAPRRVARRIVS